MFTTALQKSTTSPITPEMLMNFYLNGKAIFVPQRLLSEEQSRWGNRIIQIINLSEVESILILS